MILLAGILRNMHAIVDGVGGARGNQADINHRAGGPGVALVDRIAVLVDLQRTIEVRAFLHRAFAVVLDHAAPENGLALVVGGLQLQPGVVGINRAPGKKWPIFLRANDDVDAHCIATAKHGCTRLSGAVTGASFGLSRKRSSLRPLRRLRRWSQDRIAWWQSGLQPAPAPARWQKYPRSECPFFRKFSVSLSWSASSFAVGTAVFAAGKAMRVHKAIDVAEVRRMRQAACGNRRTAAASADSRTTARPARRLRWPASCHTR